MRLPLVLVGCLLVACAKRADVPVPRETKNDAPLPPPLVAAGDGGVALSAEPVSEGVDEGEAASDAGPFVSRCEGISLVMVSAKQDPYSVDVVLELRNDGRAPVSLMTTGDGSSHDMRNPTVTFDLAPNERSLEARCGNVNALSAKDFVTLAPGARHRLEWIRGPRPAKKGRYTLRATFENDPRASILRGLAAPPDRALLARARATVPCRVTSNALVLEWK